VRVRPCDNVHTLAARTSLATPTAAARPMHRGRSLLRTACGTPLPGARPARGGRLSHGLKPRGTAQWAPAALGWNPVRFRPCGNAGTSSAPVGFCVMRYEVRSGVAGRDPASVRRIRLRQRLTDRAEHRESDHYAPHGNPYRCARSFRRACAVFRWSVAPLRHYHHKFLRWPRSRRATSAYPQATRRDSTDSDARQANHHHT
jgi:hypothetical protein